MEIFNENREELNQNVKLLESDINKLKDRLFKINFISELNLSKEDFNNITDFKLSRNYNSASGGEYCQNIDGFFEINYTYTSEKTVKINFRVDFEFSESYENRYNPDILLEPQLTVSGASYDFSWPDREIESLEETSEWCHLINTILSRDEDEDYNFWTDLMEL